ncbi:MAG: YfhO family protein [Clostridia bacterium]|nr:YfhO family protein [Clostridia bacterium]
MKKKSDLKYYITLTLFFIIQFLIITRFGQYLYGSTIDWDHQHYKIPEYFRTLFYSTGDLFPDFAPNLGAGQNIYNLSYYGLFNPVIMLSYLLPFVPMKIYIQVSTVLLIYIACILCYRWLLGHFDRNSALMTTMIFILSSPLLFHTHRHIMFVNYMPFLIMAFMGVDQYFSSKKRWLLALSVCLICLMSYFYSIGCIVAIVLYGIYIFIKKSHKVTFKGFWCDGTLFLLPIFLGIFMAAFLLVPTFIALLAGRAEGGASVDIVSLFIPNVNTDFILHGSYSLGLTSISLYALIYNVAKFKRENRFMGIILSLFIIFPIFVYALNGAMYISAKALIPFIPLYCLLIAKAVEDMFKKKKADIQCLILFAVLAVALIIKESNNPLLIADLLITLASIIVFSYFRKRRIVVSSIAVISLIAFFSAAFGDTLMEPSVNSAQSDTDRLIEYAIDNDDSLFRINDKTGELHIANRVVNGDHYITTIYSSLSNQNYQEFYYDRIGNEIRNRSRGQLSNPFNFMFNLYMGSKYTIGNDLNELGNEIVTTDGELTLYVNNDSLPVGYVSNRLMSKKQFDTLSYPYNAEALLNYIIVDEDVECDYQSAVTEANLEYEITNTEGVEITEYDGGYQVYSKNGGSIEVALKNEIKDKIVFLEFELEEANRSSVGDNHIAINNTVNKLSYRNWRYDNRNKVFQYTFNEKSIDSFTLDFYKGTYKIINIKAFTANYDEFVSRMGDVSPMIFDLEKTSGDVVEGDIDVASAGYFNISIPYDKGFTVYVDGEVTEHEMTDTAFIGLKMDEGKHHIKIVYTAPTANISKIVSAVAWAGFIAVLWFDLRKKKAQ